MGGGSYVNTYQLILEDKKITKDEKELSIGLCNKLYLINKRLNVKLFWNTYSKYIVSYFCKYFHEMICKLN